MTYTNHKTHDITQHIQDLLSKHADLMWYGRSNPASDVEFWNDVPDDIRQGAFQSQMKVEEDYPDEVAELRNDETGWHHGFNSGVVAAIRFMFTAQQTCDVTEGDETVPMGGIQEALDEFPELYT
jgi:hypothetical protein